MYWKDLNGTCGTERYLNFKIYFRVTERYKNKYEMWEMTKLKCKSAMRSSALAHKNPYSTSKGKISKWDLPVLDLFPTSGALLGPWRLLGLSFDWHCHDAEKERRKELALPVSFSPLMSQWIYLPTTKKYRANRAVFYCECVDSLEAMHLCIYAYNFPTVGTR